MWKKILEIKTELLYILRNGGILYLYTEDFISNLLCKFKWFRKIPKNSFSQYGQDLIAEELLIKIYGNIPKIAIVDIGSNHPTIINNTYYFEKKYLCRVENIDPNPNFIDLYRENERTFNNFAVGSSHEQMELYVPKRDLYRSTFQDHVHASLLADELPEECEELEKYLVDVRPLEHIINSGHYHILFIDVEGFEIEVLNGIDFASFTFDIIFIENNSKNRDLRSICDFLHLNDYKFYGRILKLDDIYVRNSLYKSILK